MEFSNMNTINIRAVLYEEGDVWIAQCLDYDISTQAPDLISLQDRFEATLIAEFDESTGRNGEPFKGIPPAPAHFFEKWEASGGKFIPKMGNLIRANSDQVSLDLALCA